MSDDRFIYRATIENRHVVVTEVDPSEPLKQSVWRFTMHDLVDRNTLHLDHFADEERATTRHKWRKVTWWNRLGHRRESSLLEEEVPMRHGVVANARLAIRDWVMTCKVTPERSWIR